MRNNHRLQLIALLLAACLLIPGKPLPIAHGWRADCTSVIDALRMSTGQCRQMTMGNVCNGHNNVTVSPQQPFNVSAKLDVRNLSGLNTQTNGPGVALMLLGGESGTTKLVFYGDTRVNQLPTSTNNPTLRASMGRGLLCDNTRSGIMIQNQPGEVGIVTVNGVLIQLSSTAAITMEADTGGTLTYYSDQDGDWDVYRLDLTTSQASNLTNNTSNDAHTTFSPDGGTIAFQSDRTGNNEIFTMDANGANVRQLTFDGAFAAHPNWSPAGGWIAFDSTVAGSRDIFVMTPDSGNRRNLTNSAPSVENIWPVWSPDGGWIAFYSDRDGDREIYVMDSVGGNLRQLTFTPSDDRYPSWSPDGSRIVFASTRDGNWELYTMDPYGNDAQRLTFDSGTDWGATYTPDGGQIVFASDQDGDNELYIMSANGGPPTQFTFNNSRDELPVWQAGGGGVDHWMVVTNVEGQVAAGPAGTTSPTPIPQGQQLRVAMDPAEQPLRFEPPTPAGIAVQSPVVSWLTFDIDGLNSIQDTTTYID